ncbi:unnamed protein product, partial [Effrenium voratum]
MPPESNVSKSSVRTASKQETLELGWAKAFLRDGLMMQQERMSEGLMLALGSAGVPELRREPPSLAEAKAMPPRGLKLNIIPRDSGDHKGREDGWPVSASTRQGALMHAIASPLVGMVYNYSGRDPAITVDFVYGRGQSRRRHLEEGMPALCGRRAACAARYVVEHQLFGWIVEQNSEHGVAPSRDQLVEKEVVPLEERQAKARRRLAQVEASVFEAFAFFKWINFALSEAPADRDPLIVNMDETALAYHIPAAQGTVATVARRAGGGQAVDHASLADTRGHVSYLATVASDPTVQPQLPQETLELGWAKAFLRDGLMMQQERMSEGLMLALGSAGVPELRREPPSLAEAKAMPPRGLKLNIMKRRLEAVSASTRQGALMHAIASPLVGMVYNYSGRDPAITVDFVYGRGQSRRRHLEEGMPALCGRRAACAARYVVEHQLFGWIVEQNSEHGVAPSRDQLVEKALCFTPSTLPSEVRRALAASFNAQPRAQRKWLARFRARWGARLGVLKVQEVVPLEERQAKARRRLAQVEASVFEAFAFFKWINFALSEAPADRDPLIVNMDETALAYHIPAAQGTVATVARRAGGGQAVDHASLADTRGHVSYLATVASDPTVQPQLPQETLELGWAKAFLRDGLMMQQERMSEGLMLALGSAGVPELRREPPSLAEAKAMPPRGLKLNIMKRRLEAVSASTRQGALMHAIASPLVGMVYNYSGRDPAITVDFVYGRGQSRRRHLEEGMPALCGRRAACAARYVVEHQLFGWIVEQNSEHGVAPSRDQLVGKEVVPLEERQAKARRRLAQVEASVFEAFAFFKWINFALSEAPADRDPLIVNMDETALAYHIPAAQGTVATVARRAGGGQAVDHASLADTRGHVSYLATVASDPTVQPQLPQETLELGWAKAFLRDGLMMQQERMSEGLMLALGSAGVPELRREPPSLAEAKAMPPRGLKLNIMSYALLWEELARLKKQKEEAKKSAREAAKKEKNAVKRRGRLLKAARGLCKEDLQLLLAAKNKSEQAGQTAAQ